MYAQITLVGRVTHDVELKTSPRTGVPYMRLNVAVNEGYGEHQHTSYYQCWLDNEEALRADKAKVRKGSLLFISGAVSIVDVQRQDGAMTKVAKVSRARWDYLPISRQNAEATLAPAVPMSTAPIPAARTAAAQSIPVEDLGHLEDEGDLPF